MILLVIILNNILLKYLLYLFIILFLTIYFSQYIKLYLSIIKNWLSYIVLMRVALVIILFDKKCDNSQPIFSLLHIRADDPHCIFC